MRKSFDILVIIFTLWALISGLVESDAHIVVSFIFAVLICIHVVLYRRLLICQLKTMRWEWVLVVLGFGAIILTTIID
jgi:hypothetical protein